MSRTYILIFATSAVCLFRVVITAYIQPSEPFHNGGFGAEDFPLPRNEGMMKYRILHRSGDVFYVGGRATIHRIDPHSATCESASLVADATIGTCAPGGGALPCRSVAPIDEAVDCHNYIRIVEEFTTANGDDRLLVCGTNALEPRCYIFEFLSSSCELNSTYPSHIGEADFCNTEKSYDAKNIAPRNWNLNYTYLYTNDGANNFLFTGVSKANDETDPIWAKVKVTEANLGTETTPFEQLLDTYEIESRAVNQANFVGKPYEYTEDGSTFVLFFYRETAVEFINHGKIVYSRVGRVCKNDAGNSYKWSSFLKARLNCSLPNDYPAYFNEIQDVSTIEEGGETYFYSVLATPSNGVSTSALCRFRLSDIHNLFQNSKFKSPKSSKSLWLPVDPTDEPDPRPGSNCGEPSRQTTFIQNNPLLDDLVENYNPDEPRVDKSDAPLFYTDFGGRFSTIAVDKRSGSIDDNIYYIGTESGNVLKAYKKNGKWIVFRYWQQDGHEAITSLEFIPKEGSSGPYIFATTDNSLTKIDLEYGKAQNVEQHNAVYYPYLERTSLDLATGAIVESSSSTIKTCDNRHVNLFCEGRLDSTSGVGNITWYMGEQPITETLKGHLLRQTHLTGSLSEHPASFVTILALKDKSDQAYSCEVTYLQEELETKERKDFTVVVNDCITDYAVQSRKQEFNQVTEAASNRTDRYEDDGVCVIEQPILCEQSCPYR